jgi:sulfotransferase
LQSAIHFMSGLPRAGSTLLSAILRQHPRFHAGITDQVGSLVEAMLRNMKHEQRDVDLHQRRTTRGAAAAIFATFSMTCPTITSSSIPIGCGAPNCR